MCTHLVLRADCRELERAAGNFARSEQVPGDSRSGKNASQRIKDSVTNSFRHHDGFWRQNARAGLGRTDSDGCLSMLMRHGQHGLLERSFELVEARSTAMIAAIRAAGGQWARLQAILTRGRSCQVGTVARRRCSAEAWLPRVPLQRWRLLAGRFITTRRYSPAPPGSVCHIFELLAAPGRSKTFWKTGASGRSRRMQPACCVLAYQTRRHPDASARAPRPRPAAATRTHATVRRKLCSPRQKLLRPLVVFASAGEESLASGRGTRTRSWLLLDRGKRRRPAISSPPPTGA